MLAAWARPLLVSTIVGDLIAPVPAKSLDHKALRHRLHQASLEHLMNTRQEALTEPAVARRLDEAHRSCRRAGEPASWLGDGNQSSPCTTLRGSRGTVWLPRARCARPGRGQCWHSGVPALRRRVERVGDQPERGQAHPDEDEPDDREHHYRLHQAHRCAVAELGIGQCRQVLTQHRVDRAFSPPRPGSSRPPYIVPLISTALASWPTTAMATLAPVVVSTKLADQDATHSRPNYGADADNLPPVLERDVDG
jgi:hypothetical protein